MNLPLEARNDDCEQYAPARARSVYTVPRPYILGFAGSSATFPLSQEEADRLLETYTVKRATASRVVLHGLRKGHEPIITPATLGGGPAFEIV